MATIPTTTIHETASRSEAMAWARTCGAGEYLATFDAHEDSEDPTSLCGYSEPLLADVKRVLRDRGMVLESDDLGLVAKRTA